MNFGPLVGSCWQSNPLTTSYSFVSLSQYLLFATVLYIIIALLFLAVALCVFIGHSFQNNRLDSTWCVPLRGHRFNLEAPARASRSNALDRPPAWNISPSCMSHPARCSKAYLSPPCSPCLHYSDSIRPAKALLWYSAIFFQALEVATMTLLFIPLDCQYFGSTAALTYYNKEFPDLCECAHPALTHTLSLCTRAQQTVDYNL